MRNNCVYVYCYILFVSCRMPVVRYLADTVYMKRIVKLFNLYVFKYYIFHKNILQPFKQLISYKL